MHFKDRFIYMLFLLTACMSSQAQTVTSSPETGVTPNTLLLYRADLIAGKEAAYEQTEAEIVRGYGRAKIPVYWVALQAVTSSPHVLYFGGFDSFAAVEQAGQDVAQGLGTHPNSPASSKNCRSTSRERARSWPSAATTSAIA